MELFSEPFQPTGSTGGIGVLNQLGRPDLDQITLLVREAAQNSWDARLDQDLGPSFRTVEFAMRFQKLDAARATYLRHSVLQGSPPGIELDGAIRPDALMLLVSDRNTRGLGGPLRADALDRDDPRDFVDLVRNVGQPPDRAAGGGTFGYGKGSYFLASSCATIVIHTRCVYRGRPETRLVGYALGDDFIAEKPFTGRHWWGHLADDGIVDPVVGAEADEIADRLGLPGFSGASTGTTFAIIDPQLDGRSAADAARFAASSMAWHLWPKMVERDGAIPMSFLVEVDGEPLRVPSAEEFPPLALYARSLRALDGAPFQGTVKMIESGNPRRQLGRLAISIGPNDAWQTEDADGRASSAPIRPPSRHIALLREPRLVVAYRPGPALAADLTYGGVFLAEPELDRTFAAAEPPTHDAWNPGMLGPSERRFVNVALRRIDEAVREFATPREAIVTPGDTLPVAALSDYLAKTLMPGIEGVGTRLPSSKRRPETPHRPSSPRQARRMSGQVPTTFVELGLVNGEALAYFTVDVAGVIPGARLVARTWAAVQDGSVAEQSPPLGAEIPAVALWFSPERHVVPGDEAPIVADPAAGSWTLVVLLPTDAAVSAQVVAEAASQ